MVAPIRDFGNKFFFSSTNTHSQQTFYLPTVSSSTNTGINILSRNTSDNYDKMRDKTYSPKPQSSRVSSISSTKSLVAYYKRIECNNGLNKDVNMDNSSPQLSYKIFQEQTKHVSMVADPNNNIMNKCVIIEYFILSSSCVLIEHSTLVPPHVNNCVINIQLLYDPNAPTEPKL